LKPRLLITRPLPQSVLDAADLQFETVKRSATSPLSALELRAALTDFDAVLPTLGDAFSAAVFADVPSPRARILANFGVGYNHIDASAARAKGIIVTNTPGAVTDATADIAITLMLMTARRAGEGERILRGGDWHGWSPTQMLGLPMTGQSVGIIGMGRIGQAIARRCHFGFGMDVCYFNRSAKSLDFPTRAVDLPTAMDADFVVIAVSGGAHSRHLIGADTLAHMRRIGIFINISRGDVVDEGALAQALARGHIAGAGLDVYENEPQITPALLGMQNVTLLPHLGTAVLTVREAMGMMALDNLTAFFKGLTPPNAV
jgi:lactate dehydrogenase-like 2-hydroxyacid dehydrogenase